MHDRAVEGEHEWTALMMVKSDSASTQDYAIEGGPRWESESSGPLPQILALQLVTKGKDIVVDWLAFSSRECEDIVILGFAKLFCGNANES